MSVWDLPQSLRTFCKLGYCGLTPWLAVQVQDVAAGLEACLAEAHQEKQRLADANAALQKELGMLREESESTKASVSLSPRLRLLF